MPGDSAQAADLAQDTLLTVGADYQNNDPKGSTWGGIPVYDSNGDFNKTSRSFNLAARWSSWEQYTRTAFATLEHYFDNDWVAKLKLNHQINGYDNRMGSIGSGFPDPATGADTSLWLGSYAGKTVSNAADLYTSGPFSLFGRKHELVVGGSTSRRKWTNEGQWAGATAIADFYEWNGSHPEPNWSRTKGKDETTREQGFYLATRLNLRDDLKLLVGSRVADYEKEDLKKSEVVVPYLGVVYDLNRQLSLYGSHTSIFKPQSAQNEQGRTLDPLESNNTEIGLKGAFFGGRQQKPRLNGERVSTLAPEKQFSLYTSYKLSGKLRGLTLGGGARWQDDTWSRVNHPALGKAKHIVEGYWLVDATAHYQINRHMSAMLAINNLLDEKYYTIFDSNYSWGEPRSTSISLKYTF